jgi:hypothetical protein
MLSAQIEGAFLHMAIALQNGTVFQSPSELWEFVRGQCRGNLANLTATEKRRLVTPYKLETVSKTALHSIRPMLHAETLGEAFMVPQNVGELCENAARSRQITGAPFPIALGNGTFCTIHDLTQNGEIRDGVSLIRYCEFDFTRGALLCAAYWSHILEPLTLELIADGKSCVGNQATSIQQYYEFSRRVCLWGGRAGIYNKMESAGQLSKLHQWLAFSAKTNDALDAVTKGIAIAGLGVSFASKHLRFVDPARYATFDSLLAQATGLPLNPDGYVRFLDDLNALKANNGLNEDLATIEMGLFSLIRPYFDAENLRPRTKESAKSDNIFTSISPEAISRDFEYLGNFSSSIALYRRRGLPHIYGFATQPIEYPGHPERGRHRLNLVLMLREVPEHRHSVFEPELFSVNHLALRPRYALEYLTWWMNANLGQQVLPFATDVVATQSL